MEKVDRNSSLWFYLTPEVKDLVEDGEILISFVEKYREQDEISDFSFLVFPFAKAYEGFCKKFFLDLEIITMDEYYGEDIRIGRLLSPRYQNEEGNSIRKVCKKVSGNDDLSKRMWDVWKKGRNLVFHYFPHNFRKLSFEEAMEIINDFMDIMQHCVGLCNL